MDPSWLILLLPTAMAAGWFAARRQELATRATDYNLPSAYFEGLNFLLNEQPDKAIEVFIKMLEVDSETVEMHLALGSLFRRRGEVERATRIHQNLIARPNLDSAQRQQAMYELAQDYLKAGLLDRAESLFLELTEIDGHDDNALRHLLIVYEQEREWEKCIQVARKLSNRDGREYAADFAQYYCELAEAELTEGRYESARKQVDAALRTYPNCVRATMQLGRLQATLGDHRSAIDTWRRVEQQDPRFLGEVVDLITGSYQILDDTDGLTDFLEGALNRHNDNRLMLAMAETLERRDGDVAGEQFLVDWLRSHPSVYGLQRLIQLKLKSAAQHVRQDLDVLDSMIGGMLQREPGYECQRCGFTGRKLHWQCPGCKSWNKILPAMGKHLLQSDVLEAGDAGQVRNNTVLPLGASSEVP